MVCGNFFDARLDVVKQYPVAAKAKLGTSATHRIWSRCTCRPWSSICSPCRFEQYDQFLGLKLTNAEKGDLIEYLKSL